VRVGQQGGVGGERSGVHALIIDSEDDALLPDDLPAEIGADEDLLAFVEFHRVLLNQR
jgi:hypothetical protein